MLRLLLAAVALLLSPPALAKSWQVASVHDGDTFSLQGRFTPWGLPLSVRVLGVDTPELWTAKCPQEKAAAVAARDHVRDLVRQAGGLVTLDVKGWDKYGGRVNAQVYLRINRKRVDLAQNLIAGGFAAPYSGSGPKRDWCEFLIHSPISGQGSFSPQAEQYALSSLGKGWSHEQGARVSYAPVAKASW